MAYQPPRVTSQDLIHGDDMHHTARKNFKPHALKRSALLLIITTLLALPGATALEAGKVIAPNWSLELSDGSQFDFYSQTEGRASVVLFWATWCPYCRRLMPHLEQIRAEYADQGVRFLALNIWEDGDPVAYFEAQGYQLELIQGADFIAEEYGVKGTPSLLVVDAPFHGILNFDSF